VVAAEKGALQKSMNYGVGKGLLVFLMSLRENAPYSDVLDPMELPCCLVKHPGACGSSLAI
jgi:hypothetical protein